VGGFQGNDVALKGDQSGLFTGLLSTEDSGALMATLSCHCASCASMTDDGAGGSIAGSYATTPTDGAYRYVGNTQAPVSASGDNVAALMAGSKWTSLDTSSAKTIITFSFADPATSTFSYSNNDFQSTLSAFSGADRQLTRELLARIEAVCDVQFVEVADNAAECGVLRYGYSQQPNVMNFAGYAFFPSSGAIGGDVWIGANQARAEWDFYRPDLILHETLHALGLKHPFSTGEVLSAGQDIIPNTVMSYSTMPGSTGGYMSKYPGEPMPLDIAALQYLYGASASNAGNNRYDLATSDFQTGFHAVWDAGGIDVFDAGRVGRGVTLDLNEGASSNVGVTVSANGTVAGSKVSTSYSATLSIAAGAVIENAVGSAFGDTIVGNGAANRLEGGGGDDRIEGGAGKDVLVGGSGRNSLDGGDGLDTAVFESSRAGYSLTHTGQGLQVSGANSTDSLSGIERLSFSDVNLAFDLDGHAGTAAKVIGAVFGAAAVQNEGIMGVVLQLLDGGMSCEGLMQAALGCRLGANAGNGAVVDLLLTNLLGSAPGAATKDAFVGLLDQGAFTQVGLGQIAAEHALTLAHIDLVGLAANGLEYA
jgi:serralysin